CSPSCAHTHVRHSFPTRRSSDLYLSQIERGLREPSERVLEAIAGQLEVSAETLYEEAGFSKEDEQEESEVVTAIRDDPNLTARQDRKSTRLNSSHRTISYAVFCL